MRTSTLVVLSLSTAATLVTAKDEGGGGGALQALLERMQKTKHDQQHERRGLKDAQVRPAPSDYSNGTDSFEVRNSSRPAHESAHSSKFAKSTDRPSRHGARPSLDSSSSSSKTRLYGTESARRPKSTNSEDLPTSALERKLRVAESGKPLTEDAEEYDSLTSAEPSSTKKVQQKPFGKKHEDKRWVWATSIIQDDSPVASGVPPAGQNANLLNSIPVNTPAAALVAPSFPPLVAPSFPPLAAKSSSQTTPAAVAKTTPAAVAKTTTPAVNKPITNRKNTHVHAQAAKEKRWTWGTSIIQDGSSDAPPVGENANLLSSGTTIALNTPVAALTPPSFPPLADATTSSAPSVETPNTGADAAAQVVASASSTLSSVAAEVTSVGTSGIQALLVKLQAEIDALARVYAQATATSDAVDAAASTSPAENAKRWVWGPSIIQDDSPSSLVPPVGQNTNLFNPSIPAASPTAQLVPPSFPPIVPSPVASSVSAAGAKALGAGYAGRVGLAHVASPVPVVVDSNLVTPPAEDTATAAASTSTTTTTTVHRNRKSEADSIRSARDAASKTAALEWHLVNKKRKVGGMAKQHKRQ